MPLRNLLMHTIDGVVTVRDTPSFSAYTPSPSTRSDLISGTHPPDGHSLLDNQAHPCFPGVVMYADVEALVLSGELFNGTSRSSSPSRSIHADDDDRGWHDDEYIAEKQKQFEEKGLDYDSDAERLDLIKSKEQQEIQLQQSIGMGPGRTGVKGVIRDRAEAVQIQREKKAKEMEEIKQKMEATNLGGKTYLEEEWEKLLSGEKADKLVSADLEKIWERPVIFGGKRQGKFGHLREVGLSGFLSAVEKEDKSVWVVVHLYEPSLDRCYLIDEKLSRLAREYPDIKFLRARAATLGFASLKTNRQKSGFTRMKRTTQDDEDDPYADEKGVEYEDDDEVENFREDDVDLDMLPTMLVYQNGDLVYNWVRVDWEAGDAGLEEHLVRHRILPQSQTSIQFCFPEDSELDFDFGFSDDDNGDI